MGGEEQLYSAKLACPDCGISVPQLEPRSFSFNSAYGACPECHGWAAATNSIPAKVIIDWSKPLLDGGLGPGSARSNLHSSCCKRGGRAYGFDLGTPFEKLSGEDAEPAALRRAEQKEAQDRFPRNSRLSSSRVWRNPPRTPTANFCWITCRPRNVRVCQGKRLRPESLAVKVNGMSIADFTALPVSRALEAARKIKLNGREA